MRHTERQYHLALPQRNCIHDRGLDLFHHHGIIVLYQSDLRCCLDGDHSRQFQIMNLLFKSSAHRLQISGRLCILCKSAGLRFRQEFLQLSLLHFFQLFLSCQNIHRQLFKICQVQFIHLIQNRNIFHQLYLMSLQSLADLVDIRLRLGIFCFQCLNLICLLFEDSEKSFFFFLVKIFQLLHNIPEKFSHFPQVLCLYIFQCCL